MQIRDKPLEYVLVPPKYSIQEKNISFFKNKLLIKIYKIYLLI